MGCGGRINTQINDFVKGNDLEKNSYAIYEVLESSRHIVAIIRGPPELHTNTESSRLISEYQIIIRSLDPTVNLQQRYGTSEHSSQTGVICLDILREQWTAITIGSVLVSIQTFLSSPKPNDPQDAVVANQFLTQRYLWHKTAKYCTFVYAMDDEYKKKIHKNYFKDYD